MQIQPNRLNKKFKYMRHNKELACQITTQKTASGIEMLVLKNPKKDFAVKCSNLATRYLQYDFLSNNHGKNKHSLHLYKAYDRTFHYHSLILCIYLFSSTNDQASRNDAEQRTCLRSLHSKDMVQTSTLHFKLSSQSSHTSSSHCMDRVSVRPQWMVWYSSIYIAPLNSRGHDCLSG